MAISTRPSKKRKLKGDPAHKLERKAYALKMRNPTARQKAAKAAKLYRQKNRAALRKKAQATRRARKNQPVKKS